MPHRIGETGRQLTPPESGHPELASGKMNDRVVRQGPGVPQQSDGIPGKPADRELEAYDIARADNSQLVAKLKKRFTEDVKKLKTMQLEVASELLRARYKDSSLLLQDSLARQVRNKLEKQHSGSVKLVSDGSSLLDKKAIKQLKIHEKIIRKVLARNGFKISKKAFAQGIVKKLGEHEWSTISRQFHLGGGGKKFNVSQHSTPASKIGHELLSPSYQEHDIFPHSYENKPVVSHAVMQKEHATNLYVSETNLEASGSIDKLTIVRHGINSAYGLKESEGRHDASVNRAREVIIAALATQPDRFKRALDGERVSLTMTSSSLVTPDRFRKVIVPQHDEKTMLADQQKAFNTLRSESPLTLEVRDSNGQIKTITVDLHLVPFNFGVNKFAVGNKVLESIGGWGTSDALNRDGIEQLLGDPKSEDELTGIVGQWLQEHSEDANAPIVRQLGRQIKEIFNARGHHTAKGGAYKLPARVIVLTSLIGGVPCTNCKSGKDRTSMAVAASEALFTYLKMNGRVPDWRSVGATESELFRTLCLNGGHHEIQRRNVGASGFKVQPEILRAYGMSKEDVSLVMGLSDSVPG